MTVLTDILLMEGLVTDEQLQPSIAKFGNTREMEKDLVKRKIISDTNYAQTLAESLELPYTVLADQDIPENIVSMLPDAVIRNNQVLPLSTKNKHLNLAMVDPNNLIAIDDVTNLTGFIVNPVVVSERDMNAAIDTYVRSDDELNTLTEKLEEMSDDGSNASDAIPTRDSDADEPVVRFVNLVISQAIQDRASDIHIEPNRNDVRVRYRIDGVLHEVHTAPKNTQDGIISRLKVVSNIDIAERRRPQDGRMTVAYNNGTIDLRVATLPTVWGEKVVMRILSNTATSMTLKEMHMSEHNYDVFHEMYTKPHGMILVTGPTGSGKSTTLYTTLNAISTPEVNVITVEDPVEYRLPGINQVQVNNKAGMTFAAALRSILRCDPDVVLVGEIRDTETAQTSVEASLTGHLVLSTLHTNNAPSAITRLTDMGIEPFLVGSSLECVVAQRLARKLCVKCREPYHETQEMIDKLKLPVTTETVLYRNRGCSACSKTGYKGRVALHEVMRVSEGIEKLAVSRASSTEIMEQAVKDGMIPLKQDGWDKVIHGLTSIEEVLRVVV